MTLLLCALLLAAPGDTLELDLAGALRLALRGSPAREEVAASRIQGGARLGRGIAGLLPTVGASVGYEKSSSIVPESLRVGDGWYWSGALTVSQVVFDPTAFAGLAGGIVYAGYYADDARDKQARLVYDVVADYLGLLKAGLLRDAAASALDRADENLRLFEEKERVGAASPIELLQSQVQRAQADIDLLGADKALAVATENLRATLGLAAPTPVRATEELTEPAGFTIDDPDSLVAEIERRNPGTRLLERAETAARWNSAAAVGRALPSVSAYWTSTYADTTFPSSPGHWDEQDVATWGLRASFPLLDIKSYVLGIIEAGADTRRARAAARSARLQLRSTATAAVIGYEEARRRYEFATRNLELNERLFELAREQHRLGNVSTLELLTVESGLAAAEASHISALCDTYIQAAQVSYLLGSAEPPSLGKERQ